MGDMKYWRGNHDLASGMLALLLIAYFMERARPRQGPGYNIDSSHSCLMALAP